jgi:hypothetical protein
VHSQTASSLCRSGLLGEVGALEQLLVGRFEKTIARARLGKHEQGRHLEGGVVVVRARAKANGVGAIEGFEVASFLPPKNFFWRSRKIDGSLDPRQECGLVTCSYRMYLPCRLPTGQVKVCICFHLSFNFEI